METPIADFVRRYADSGMIRAHMPGHKGKPFLGCETLDITEIQGADSLYEAEGIIRRSESYAGELFGSGRTVYSTEGSSQCIRAMLYLALTCGNGSRTVVAARNVHRAFVYAAALLDFEIVWLWPEQSTSLCSWRSCLRRLRRSISPARTIWAAWRTFPLWQRCAGNTVRFWRWTTPTAPICGFWNHPVTRWILAQTCAAIRHTRRCRC